MGLAFYQIKFEPEIPSLFEIQESFKKQTGLEIYYEARLHLARFPSSVTDIMEQLNGDLVAVTELEKQKIKVYATHKEEHVKYVKQQDYEIAAQLRDNTKRQINLIDESLSNLNHIVNFRLIIPDFYPIDFTIENNTIITEYTGGYAFASFMKVLYDLGGTNANDDSLNYSQKWKKLKRWNDYSWYNRPRK